jgi:glycerol kinase
VLDAVNADAGVDLTELKVDGGMVKNETLMQFQADILGVPVIRPQVAETTALGAAYVAGLAVGYWSSREELRRKWAEDKRFEPQIKASARENLMVQWKKAVTKSFGWTWPEGIPFRSDVKR